MVGHTLTECSGANTNVRTPVNNGFSVLNAKNGHTKTVQTLAQEDLYLFAKIVTLTATNHYQKTYPFSISISLRC